MNKITCVTSYGTMHYVKECITINVNCKYPEHDQLYKFYVYNNSQYWAYTEGLDCDNHGVEKHFYQIRGIARDHFKDGLVHFTPHNAFLETCFLFL